MKKLKAFFTAAKIQGFAALTCFALLGYAGYLQTVKGIEPCPLCILQRIYIVILAFIFLINSLYFARRRWRQFYHSLIFVISGIGAATAGRQIWLQKHPSDVVTPCPADFGTLLSNLPLKSFLKVLFTGTGECAQAGPPILGISIPMWSLVFFAIFGVIGFVLAVRD